MFVFLCRWQQCCWHPTEGLCKYVPFSPHTHVPLMIMRVICLPIPSLSASLFLFSLFLFIFPRFLLPPLLLLLSSPFLSVSHFLLTIFSFSYSCPLPQVHHALSSLFPSLPAFPFMFKCIRYKWFIHILYTNVFRNSGSTTSTTSKRSEKLEMLTDPSRITVDDSTYKGPHVSLPLTLLTVRNIIELYKSHKVCTKTDKESINISRFYLPLESNFVWILPVVSMG